MKVKFKKINLKQIYINEGIKKMSEEHKMTKKDKLVLTITLAAIFVGVFGLGLAGLLFNLFG